MPTSKLPHHPASDTFKLYLNQGVKAATKLSLPELREAVQDRDVCKNLIIIVTSSQTQLDGTTLRDKIVEVETIKPKMKMKG